MKTRLLKISMMIVGLMFVFTAVSWADGGSDRYRKHGPEKRIHAKHHDGGFYQQPVHYQNKHKINHRKKWVRAHRQHHRKQLIRKHRRYHRHQWDHKHRHYSDSSYDDGDTAYNEFSVAATFSEPGVEFSIGTKRTW